jgi:hypothetical protein
MSRGGIWMPVTKCLSFIQWAEVNLVVFDGAILPHINGGTPDFRFEKHTKSSHERMLDLPSGSGDPVSVLSPGWTILSRQSL